MPLGEKFSEIRRDSYLFGGFVLPWDRIKESNTMIITIRSSDPPFLKITDADAERKGMGLRIPIGVKEGVNLIK